ncbi:MAG: hypothetical protein GF311_16200 [Candidatus Lokiarchaeota archaeon]|nr:hypothetical protein [Candidatus Lokiarchaeota archaeon]
MWQLAHSLSLFDLFGHPYLERSLLRGYHYDETIQYLINSGFGAFDLGNLEELKLIYADDGNSLVSRKKNGRLFFNEILHDIYGAYLNDYSGSNQYYTMYDHILMKEYYTPFVEYLRQNGFDDLPERVGAIRGLDGTYVSRPVWVPYTDLSITEILFARGVQLKRIAELLSTNTEIYTNQEIRSYLDHK